eukprot:TRINITY_DN4475_c0_g2_i2.p2 TRINITY_DN4475_c0_g2~~TRINITY_DN4475_c0_g2_i2.p2  ORF type:complete len:125 (-),score=14.69 TRINITY_DN4475_c0_g2_i2:411-785(-)
MNLGCDPSYLFIISLRRSSLDVHLKNIETFLVEMVVPETCSMSTLVMTWFGSRSFTKRAVRKFLVSTDDMVTLDGRFSIITFTVFTTIWLAGVLLKLEGLGKVTENHSSEFETVIGQASLSLKW